MCRQTTTRSISGDAALRRVTLAAARCRSTSYSRTTTRCRSRSEHTLRRSSILLPRSRSIPPARTCSAAASASSLSDRTATSGSGRYSSAKTLCRSAVTNCALSRCSYFSRYTHTHTHTHTRPFNGSLSGTTRVSRYQKGKTNPDFTEARDSEWQWYQLGQMQVCTLLQTEVTTPAPDHSVFLQAGCPSCRPTNIVKALKAVRYDTIR